MAQPLLRAAVRAEHDDPAQQHADNDDGARLGQVLELCVWGWVRGFGR